jgi:hypothetical protein
LSLAHQLLSTDIDGTGNRSFAASVAIGAYSIERRKHEQEIPYRYWSLGGCVGSIGEFDSERRLRLQRSQPGQYYRVGSSHGGPVRSSKARRNNWHHGPIEQAFIRCRSTRSVLWLHKERPSCRRATGQRTKRDRASLGLRQMAATAPASRPMSKSATGPRCGSLLCGQARGGLARPRNLGC